jgi:hypothetical protein
MEEQEWKTGHAKERAVTREEGSSEKGRVKEGSKEDGYVWCTFYRRIFIPV